ncbi:MAG: hypothetical protein ACJ8H8_23110 [Geminicoccaceae bacterium]
MTGMSPYMLEALANVRREELQRSASSRRRKARKREEQAAVIDLSRYEQELTAVVVPQGSRPATYV